MRGGRTSCTLALFVIVLMRKRGLRFRLEPLVEIFFLFFSVRDDMVGRYLTG